MPVHFHMAKNFLRTDELTYQVIERSDEKVSGLDIDAGSMQTEKGRWVALSNYLVYTSPGHNP